MKRRTMMLALVCVTLGCESPAGPADGSNDRLDAATGGLPDTGLPQRDGGGSAPDAQTAIDASTPPFECDHTPCRVLPFGDSITDGYNVPGGYRIRLWSLAEGAGRAIDFVGGEENGPPQLGDHDHEGHSGWTIGGIHDIAEDVLEAHDPDIVLLHIGTNDVEFSNDTQMAQALEELLDTIISVVPDVVILLATIVPIDFADANEVVEDYNALLPGILAERASEGAAIELVDMYAAVGLEHLADGVHPSREGYDRMADAWWPRLEPRLGD